MCLIVVFAGSVRVFVAPVVMVAVNRVVSWVSVAGLCCAGGFDGGAGQDQPEGFLDAPGCAEFAGWVIGGEQVVEAVMATSRQGVVVAEHQHPVCPRGIVFCGPGAGGGRG